MQKFINKLSNNILALRAGDIGILHRGTLTKASNSGATIPPAPTSTASVDANGNSRKSPQAALRQAIDEGKFRAKVLLVPDVSKFNLRLNSYNPALMGEGLLTRLGSDKSITPNRNRRINRYLRYMYLRLLKYQGMQKPFYVVTTQLISRSNCYVIACAMSTLRKGHKNLFRSYSMKRLSVLLKRVDSLRARLVGAAALKEVGKENLLDLFSHVLSFKRKFIPKPNGKMRPLGVPLDAWRVYTKMFLPPLQLYLPSQDFQHGFKPRLGTQTAWNKVSSEIIPKRNIWEIDFRGYFPSCQPETLYDILMPQLGGSFTRFLDRMNESKPTFAPEWSSAKVCYDVTVTKESLDCLVKEVFMLTKRSFGQPHDPTLDTLLTEMKAMVAEYQTFLRTGNSLAPSSPPMPKSGSVFFNLKSLNGLLPPAPSGNFTFKSVDTLLHNSLGQPRTASQSVLENLGSPAVHAGLPQGSPLSPYLSTLVLDTAWKKISPKYPSVQWLFYADDGMFASDNDEEFNRFVEEAPRLFQRQLKLTIEATKSQVTKRAGVWQVASLKFLGIRYFPHDDRYESDTRKGNRLLYSFNDLHLFSMALNNEKFMGQFYKSYAFRTSSREPLVHKVLYLYLMWKMQHSWSPSQRQVFFNRFLHFLQPDQKASLERFVSMDTKAFEKDAQWQASVAHPPLFKEVKSLHGLDFFIKGIRLPETEDKGIFSGPYGGLMQSRLYLGSKMVPAFNTDSGSQDFVMRAIPNSLGQILMSKGSGHITVSNASSYAAGEMTRMLSSFQTGKKTPVFKIGPILSSHSRFTAREALKADPRA